MVFGFSAINIPAARAELRQLYTLPMSGMPRFLEGVNRLALASFPNPAAQFVLMRGLDERFNAFAKVYWNSDTPELNVAIADGRPSLAGTFSLLGVSFELPAPKEILILSGMNLHLYRPQEGKAAISSSYTFISTAEASRRELGEQDERIDGWRDSPLRFNPRKSCSLPHVNASAYFFPWDQTLPGNRLMAERMNVHVDDVPEIRANVRIANRLSDLNIRYLGEILAKGRKGLVGNGFGRTSFNALADILATEGLFFGDDVDWWVEAMQEAHRRRREALGFEDIMD